MLPGEEYNWFSTEHDASRNACHHDEPDEEKFYDRYDWRPEGRDGQSKRPAFRLHSCIDASEILSRRPVGHQDLNYIIPAGKLCRTPRVKNCPFRCTRNSLQQCTSSKQLTSRSPKFSLHYYKPSRASMQFPPNNCKSEFKNQKFNNVCLNTSFPSQYYLEYPHSRESICLAHDCKVPKMQPAGIITRNFDYKYPPDLDSTIQLASYVKHQGVYKGLGQLVKRSFGPRPGDILLMKLSTSNTQKDGGYVQFFTIRHEDCHLCSGDLLLRVGKFVKPNTWRYNKRFKLYQLTNDHRWLFTGMIDNFVNLLPVVNHGANNKNHIDEHCQQFFPRRGDMIVHFQPLEIDATSQLEWFNPKTKIMKGDILVRMYIGEPPFVCSQLPMEEEVVEGAVEVYLYVGKGFGWIFMGRDDCWYRDGFDSIQTETVVT